MSPGLDLPPVLDSSATLELSTTLDASAESRCWISYSASHSGFFSRTFPQVCNFRFKAVHAVKAVDGPKPDRHKHWSTLEALVMTRLDLLETDDVDEAHVESCQSSQVRIIPHIPP